MTDRLLSEETLSRYLNNQAYLDFCNSTSKEPTEEKSLIHFLLCVGFNIGKHDKSH